MGRTSLQRGTTMAQSTELQWALRTLSFDRMGFRVTDGRAVGGHAPRDRGGARGPPLQATTSCWRMVVLFLPLFLQWHVGQSPGTVRERRAGMLPPSVQMIFLVFVFLSQPW